MRTISATIAAELAEVVFGEAHYTVLFFLGTLAAGFVIEPTIKGSQQSPAPTYPCREPRSIVVRQTGRSAKRDYSLILQPRLAQLGAGVHVKGLVVRYAHAHRQAK